MDLLIAELIKLANILTGVLHEGDHACSPGQTLITLISYRTNVHVPFIACVINSASGFTYYLDLLNLLDCSILEF